ncbi:hypothetical protein [Deinococcus arenicola]|uniref:Uncharacterized protein n=1 Tax=Deinococcus arenicola TaxID=2994950 RepID=A0ABU4DSJ4_9DEIO|nr:hypothetical protein [Deinococcus sp. ZS9-10]MDV6375402.1 hypothetical protein [Deinococcus sp. ZS9-10]
MLFPLIGFWSLLFSSFSRARTTGTVQTVSSARAAPPQRKPVAFSVVMVIAGLFLLSSHAFVGVLLLVLGGLSLYTGLTYNGRVYPYQLQVWQQSAMCQRCGTVFVVDPSQVTLDAVTSEQLRAEQRRKVALAARPMLTQAQNLGGQAAQKVSQKVVQKAGEVRDSAQREMRRRAEARAAAGAESTEQTAPAEQLDSPEQRERH